jgi:RimJ/RimL family protein N-acetyltransferase
MNWISPVTLTGKYVTLVPLSLDHLDDLIEAVKDGELWNLWYTKVPHPDNMETEIKRRLHLQEMSTMVPFVVIANNKVVGMTTYDHIEENAKRVEIGYTWYSKSIQKSSVNTESKLLLLTHAFENLKAISVTFWTSSYNHTSRKAIERLGAKLDGVLRNHRVFKNGLIGDTYTYSIIDSEWPVVKFNLNYKLDIYNK